MPSSPKKKSARAPAIDLTEIMSPLRKSPVDKTKEASKNLLAAKSLARAIAKACVEEKVSTSEYGSSANVIDSVVEEYRLRYPSLTRQMVVDGIQRKVQQSDGGMEGEDNKGKTEEADDYDLDAGEDYEIKVGRIMGAVEEEMEAYHEKIRALKKRRESGEPDPAATAPPSKRQKSSPNKPRGRPAGWKKDTPETRFVKEVFVRYCEQREKSERLPRGLFEAIVEQTKQDRGEEHDVPLQNIRKRVTWMWIHRDTTNEEEAGGEKQEKKEFVENVYQRYARAKEHNGGKLPRGTLESIIDGCKLEFGMADKDMNWNSLKVKVQSRFTKEHPEFAPAPGVREIGKLSSGDKRRRQILINEVTARYLRLKEEGPKKLPDGSLDQIILETKQELGIFEFDVPKASIRGRIHRKSPQVMTLGDASPRNAIDEPLVAEINKMLSAGISVTRSTGLEMANKLLKEKKDGDGEEMFLDAKWWRAFLERNKHKIVCQDSEGK